MKNIKSLFLLKKSHGFLYYQHYHMGYINSIPATNDIHC